MTNFVIFGIEQWGFNKEEVGAHIGLLCKERDEINEKYEKLKKRYKKLNQLFKQAHKNTDTQKQGINQQNGG